MSGAWEILENPSVVCAILHTETTTMAWALGFKSLVIPGPTIGVTGMPFDHARNMACMRALEIGADYLFFLDSDVIPPRDGIHRLLAHRQPIMSGMYCRRSPPASVPVMMKNGTWYTDFPRGQVVEVDVVGAGCLLIRRDVLENLPPQRPGHHWFDWRVHLQGIIPPHEGLSEDFTFCTHCRKNGIRILVDTSVECRHVGTAQSTFGKFEPCEALPVF